WLGVANLPFLRPGHWIARGEMTMDLAARRGRHLEIGGDVELGLRRRHRCRLLDVERHAPFLADLVVEARFRTVRPGVPADAATNEWAQRRGGDFSRRGGSAAPPH